MEFSASIMQVYMISIFLTWWWCCACIIHGEDEIPTSTPNVTVALDGTGNYKTISEAIMAAPNHSTTRYTILIQAGVYYETIIVGPEKTYLMLIGEGANVTTIRGDRSESAGFQTHDTVTVAIHALGFVAKYLTIENLAGLSMHQAVALLADADHLAFFRCHIKGFQDTLYIKSGNQFYRECEITGTTGFIFGNAKAIFQGCVIYVDRPLYGQTNVITSE